MQNRVFVSHSDRDRALVGQLCDDLMAHGVDLWVSFRELEPGAHWDRAIQDALEDCSHVVVVVSRSSIASDYVRAEVEYALQYGKTVIPVLTESEVKLPLRWYTLQKMDWQDRSDESTSRLAAALPKNSVRSFEACLADPERGDDLRALLLRFPQWVHVEAKSEHEGKKQADFYHYSATTGGVHKHFYYLCSPYQPPFNEDGTPTADLQSALDRAAQDVIPGKITGMLAQSTARVLIFAGQRQHYDEAMLERRVQLQESWEQERKGKTGRVRVALEIASYTRLIEQLKQRSAK